MGCIQLQGRAIYMMVVGKESEYLNIDNGDIPAIFSLPECRCLFSLTFVDVTISISVSPNLGDSFRIIWNL